MQRRRPIRSLPCRPAPARSGARLAATPLLVLLLVACSNEGAVESDSIRVVITTNAQVPAELDQVQVEVRRDQNAPAMNAYFSLDETATDAGPLVVLPDTLLIHNVQPLDDTGTYESSYLWVEVTGWLGAERRVTRQAKVWSRTDKPRLLRMPLCRGCLDSTECGCEGNGCTTCGGEGSCREAETLAESLEVDDGQNPLESTECP